MPPELTPDEVRGRHFGTSLRGYDRSEVDAFRAEVAAYLADLETRLSDLDAKLNQLGLEDVPDLGVELQKVGGDISSLLGDAARAATELRERATADAGRWRDEAERDALTMREDAQAAAEKLRGHAWRESTDMLELAVEEAERVVAAGHQEVLYTRAEAEREVLRMTADARREAEGILRSARAEAQQTTADARTESDRLLESARTAAEAAQERVLALEARRKELLDEVDQARRASDAESGEETAEHPRRAWSGDGAVTIVTTDPPFAGRRVDADEMVAEVEALRSEAAAEAAVPEPGEDASPPVASPATEAEAEEVAADEPVPEDEPVSEDEPVLEPEPIAEEAVAESAPLSEGEGGGTAVEPEPISVSVAAAEPAADAAAVVTEAVEEGDLAAAPAVEPEPFLEEPGAVEGVVPGPAVAASEGPPVTADSAAAEEGAGPGPAGGNEIGSLFAELRDRSEEAAQPAAAPDAAEAEAAAAAGTEPPKSAPSPAGAPAAPAVATDTAFELRDRLLLPIENHTLRNVKRHIVELQNRVLEELRLRGGAWTPDRATFAAELDPELDAMVGEAHAAGRVAAEEMMGTRLPDAAADSRASIPSDFVDALIGAAVDALGRAGTDSGVRQRSAAVSRVFRGWRTDEAERRVRFLAYRAYHQGALSGFAVLGTPEVLAVTEGRPCPECPAEIEAAWDPAGPLPEGISVPPVHPECPTTIVPTAVATG